MKHALLIGATGLVGSHLLQLLLADDRFGSVTIFVRRTAGIVHPKIKEHIIDFEKPMEWQYLVKGDVIFLALGTTLKKAGSKQTQYMVDYNYQYQFASIATLNGVPELVLVSSAGARLKSRFFYMRMKAELERDIEGLDFKKKVFIRPGALTGPRQEKRAGERFGVAVLKMVNWVGLFRKYRPIHAQVVARAMMNAAITADEGVKVYELNGVFELGAEMK
jgi:uncharacterized protein YbjT (DUF2867 family)